MQGQFALVGVALDFLLERQTSRERRFRCLRRSCLNSEIQMTIAKTFATSRGNVDQAKSTVLRKLRPMYDALDKGLDLEAALRGKR